MRSVIPHNEAASPMNPTESATWRLLHTSLIRNEQITGVMVIVFAYRRLSNESHKQRPAKGRLATNPA